MGFLKRRGITFQSVRDKKKKTVSERIDYVRDQLCRYDDHQRRLSRSHVQCFFFPRDIFFRARDNFRKNARDFEKTAVTIFDQKKWP